MRRRKSTSFQFTPLREGRRFGSHRRRYRQSNFNSRPSARGDINAVQYEHSQDYFNSRPSARGDGWRRLALVHRRFQFTPLREGRPNQRNGKHRPRYFNSRPSARGDGNDNVHKAVSIISIHAPPRGATFCRHRMELLRPHISIHAPPRGATAKDMQFLQIFCSTLTNQHGLTIVPRNLSRLFW